MDEKKFMKVAAGVMSDKAPLLVDIKIQDAWILISSLQLTVRHPNIGAPLKAQLEAVARQFQAAIVAVHPEAAEVLEMGWHAENDR